MGTWGAELAKDVDPSPSRAVRERADVVATRLTDCLQKLYTSAAAEAE